MSAGEFRLPTVRSWRKTYTPAAKFVRLSELRRLRKSEQVAAVCYRVRDRAIEFLLVQTRGGRWIFPKGSAERGLTHAQAAALEAFEEAGVHGRIEETSFTQYLRRRRADTRSPAKLAAKAPAVSAHLCEVLRLCTPKESNRNRTWFSVDEAKRRLWESRENRDGAGFARVIDKAVARIQRFHSGTGLAADRAQQPRPDAWRTDTLQKVQFEAFAPANDRAREASFLPHLRRQIGETRQCALPAGNAHSRGTLHGEVLQFGPPRQSSRTPRLLPGANKAKASGTVAKNG